MNASAQSHVLVVEDDPKLAQLLIDYLHAEGFQTHVVNDGLLAVDHIKKERPSLILLDLTLPGLDGISVCWAVRQFSDVPIIMLTARVDEVERMLGLDSGADDYVCKPFNPREVMSRVKAQLRRAEGRLTTKPPAWVIDDEKLRISWRGNWLSLTVLEFRMLRLLLRQPGRVFSRAQLLDSMRPGDHDVSDRVIDSHVKNLRRKIQATDATFDAITSVYGIGYCFEAPELAPPT